MWLDGFECLEAIPPNGPQASLWHAAPGFGATGPPPAELRAPLQEAALALARGVERLARSEAAAARPPWAPREEVPVVGVSPPRTQLPELGMRVRLCHAAFPAGGDGGGAPAAPAAAPNGPLGGPADGLVGVVVAAGTLQSLHRPETLEEAWRAAAGRAIFRSPVLVEAPGRGCGWYDASQLCPLRGRGLAEDDVTELGGLAAATQRQLSALAMHVAGHAAAMAAPGWSAGAGGPRQEASAGGCRGADGRGGCAARRHGRRLHGRCGAAAAVPGASRGLVTGQQHQRGSVRAAVR